MPDFALNELHGGFEREVGGGSDLDADGPLAGAVVDLLGTTAEADIGDGGEWNELSRRHGDRQVAQVLRPAGERGFAHDPQVDAVAPRVEVGGVGPVDKGVDGVAEFIGGHPQVGGLLPAGSDVDLGIREVETGLRNGLCTGDELGHLRGPGGGVDDRRASRGIDDRTRDNLSHDASANLNQLREFGAGDRNLDGAAPRDGLFKQARLLGDDEGAGKFRGDLLNERHQLGDAVGVLGADAHEDRAGAGDEEEVFDHGEREVGGFRAAGVDVEERNELGFDHLAHVFELVQVVARGRNENADDEVAVARGEVFDLGGQPPGQPQAAAHEGEHHGKPGEERPATGHQAAVEADDHVDEPASEAVDGSEEKAGDEAPDKAGEVPGTFDPRGATVEGRR